MYRLYVKFNVLVYPGRLESLHNLVDYADTYAKLDLDNLEDDLISLEPKSYYTSNHMAGTVIAEGELTYNALMPRKYKGGKVYLTTTDPTKEKEAYYKTLTREELLKILLELDE